MSSVPKSAALKRGAFLLVFDILELINGYGI
jgi:hypothetical protein